MVSLTSVGAFSRSELATLFLMLLLSVAFLYIRASHPTYMALIAALFVFVTACFLRGLRASAGCVDVDSDSDMTSRVSDASRLG